MTALDRSDPHFDARVRLYDLGVSGQVIKMTPVAAIAPLTAYLEEQQAKNDGEPIHVVFTNVQLSILRIFAEASHE